MQCKSNLSPAIGHPYLSCCNSPDSLRGRPYQGRTGRWRTDTRRGERHERGVQRLRRSPAEGSVGTATPCGCGLDQHRDVNAARVILAQGLAVRAASEGVCPSGTRTRAVGPSVVPGRSSSPKGVVVDRRLGSPTLNDEGPFKDLRCRTPRSHRRHRPSGSGGRRLPPYRTGT